MWQKDLASYFQLVSAVAMALTAISLWNWHIRVGALFAAMASVCVGASALTGLFA